MLQLVLAEYNPYTISLAFAVFLYLAIRVPGRDSKKRPTSFYSSLVNR